MLNAKISGIASYVPDDILDNEMLSHMVDTNDEWITTRVGIKERRILKKDAGSSYLGIQCVNKLLAETGTKPEEVELLICATSNPDYRFPSTASIICKGSGLTNAYAYDIQAACAGFIVALEDAAAYVKSGLRKKVIVVATEKMSSMVNYQDRATCPLFGDGAGCVLVEPTEEEGVGVLDAVFHVDGSGLEHPDWRRNLGLAVYLQNAVMENNPTLMRPIALVNERYNQHLCPGSLIVEVGSSGNTLQEALAAVRLFGRAIAPELRALVQ